MMEKGGILGTLLLVIFVQVLVRPSLGQWFQGGGLTQTSSIFGGTPGNVWRQPFNPPAVPSSVFAAGTSGGLGQNRRAGYRGTAGRYLTRAKRDVAKLSSSENKFNRAKRQVFVPPSLGQLFQGGGLTQASSIFGGSPGNVWRQPFNPPAVSSSVFAAGTSRSLGQNRRPGYRGTAGRYPTRARRDVAKLSNYENKLNRAKRQVLVPPSLGQLFQGGGLTQASSIFGGSPVNVWRQSFNPPAVPSSVFAAGTSRSLGQNRRPGYRGTAGRYPTRARRDVAMLSSSENKLYRAKRQVPSTNPQVWDFHPSSLARNRLQAGSNAAEATDAGPLPGNTNVFRSERRGMPASPAVLNTAQNTSIVTEPAPFMRPPTVLKRSRSGRRRPGNRQPRRHPPNNGRPPKSTTRRGQRKPGPMQPVRPGVNKTTLSPLVNTGTYPNIPTASNPVMPPFNLLSAHGEAFVNPQTQAMEQLLSQTDVFHDPSMHQMMAPNMQIQGPPSHNGPQPQAQTRNNGRKQSPLPKMASQTTHVKEVDVPPNQPMRLNQEPPMGVPPLPPMRLTQDQPMGAPPLLQTHQPPMQPQPMKMTPQPPMQPSHRNIVSQPPMQPPHKNMAPQPPMQPPHMKMEPQPPMQPPPMKMEPQPPMQPPHMKNAPHLPMQPPHMNMVPQPPMQPTPMKMEPQPPMQPSHMNKLPQPPMQHPPMTNAQHLPMQPPHMNMVPQPPMQPPPMKMEQPPPMQPPHMNMAPQPPMQHQPMKNAPHLPMQPPHMNMVPQPPMQPPPMKMEPQPPMQPPPMKMEPQPPMQPPHMNKAPQPSMQPSHRNMVPQPLMQHPPMNMVPQPPMQPPPNPPMQYTPANMAPPMQPPHLNMAPRPPMQAPPINGSPIPPIREQRMNAPNQPPPSVMQDQLINVQLQQFMGQEPLVNFQPHLQTHNQGPLFPAQEALYQVKGSTGSNQQWLPVTEPTVHLLYPPAQGNNNILNNPPTLLPQLAPQLNSQMNNQQAANQNPQNQFLNQPPLNLQPSPTIQQQSHNQNQFINQPQNQPPLHQQILDQPQFPKAFEHQTPNHQQFNQDRSNQNDNKLPLKQQQKSRRIPAPGQHKTKAPIKRMKNNRHFNNNALFNRAINGPLAAKKLWSPTENTGQGQPIFTNNSPSKLNKKGVPVKTWFTPLNFELPILKPTTKAPPKRNPPPSKNTVRISGRRRAMDSTRTPPLQRPTLPTPTTTLGWKNTQAATTPGTFVPTSRNPRPVTTRRPIPTPLKRMPAFMPRHIKPIAHPPVLSRPMQRPHNLFVNRPLMRGNHIYSTKPATTIGTFPTQPQTSAPVNRPSRRRRPPVRQFNPNQAVTNSPMHYGSTPAPTQAPSMPVQTLPTRMQFQRRPAPFRTFGQRQPSNNGMTNNFRPSTTGFPTTAMPFNPVPSTGPAVGQWGQVAQIPTTVLPFNTMTTTTPVPATTTNRQRKPTWRKPPRSRHPQPRRAGQKRPMTKPPRRRPTQSITTSAPWQATTIRWVHTRKTFTQSTQPTPGNTMTKSWTTRSPQPGKLQHQNQQNITARHDELIALLRQIANANTASARITAAPIRTSPAPQHITAAPFAHAQDELLALLRQIAHGQTLNTPNTTSQPIANNTHMLTGVDPMLLMVQPGQGAHHGQPMHVGQQNMQLLLDALAHNQQKTESLNMIVMNLLQNPPQPAPHVQLPFDPTILNILSFDAMHGLGQEHNNGVVAISNSLPEPRSCVCFPRGVGCPHDKKMFPQIADCGESDVACCDDN